VQYILREVKKPYHVVDLPEGYLGIRPLGALGFWGPSSRGSRYGWSLYLIADNAVCVLLAWRYVAEYACVSPRRIKAYGIDPKGLYEKEWRLEEGEKPPREFVEAAEQYLQFTDSTAAGAVGIHMEVPILPPAEAQIRQGAYYFYRSNWWRARWFLTNRHVTITINEDGPIHIIYPAEGRRLEYDGYEVKRL
jgi:hypothetical protein